MVGVAKRLRPRIVVPVFLGSNPITHPIKQPLRKSGGVVLWHGGEGFERLNATVRWTVAGEGWTEAIIYFRQRRKCKRIPSPTLLLVDSSSWTIAVFAFAALGRMLCFNATQHIIAFITATFNSWIGSVTWTILPLITWH